MFGYVKAEIPELKVREKEYYRAIYCGLCRAQGKCTGQCSRFTLSYDMAFLAAVRMAVLERYPEFKRGVCIAHPVKKQPYAVMNSELEYCAHIGAILTYGKIKDDISDERGGKRFVSRMLMPFARHGRRRALRRRSKFNADIRYTEIDKIVENKLYELYALEKSGTRSVDEPAEIFGQLLSEIAAFGTSGNAERILKNIGFNLGKWVYIVDAADDCEKDKEKGRFNPFLRMYDGELPDAEQREIISDMLKVQLSALEPAFDLIEYGNNTDMQGIINNILYIGMPSSASDALRLTSECGRKGKRKSNISRMKGDA